jgi:hypothetical protein
MPLTVAPTEDTVVTALRGFLVAVMPSEFEVVQAQDNRVPEPTSPNYVLMTPVHRTRLATNIDEFDKSVIQFPTTTTVTQKTQFDYQLDVHGPLGGDGVQIVTTMVKDEWAVDFFSTNSPGISPLYASDPRQLPFAGNGEQQYEDRWIVEISLQVDPKVIFPQQYADTLTIVPKSVEVEFPAS